MFSQGTAAVVLSFKRALLYWKDLNRFKCLQYWRDFKISSISFQFQNVPPGYILFLTLTLINTKGGFLVSIIPSYLFHWINCLLKKKILQTTFTLKAFPAHRFLANISLDNRIGNNVFDTQPTESTVTWFIPPKASNMPFIHKKLQLPAHANLLAFQRQISADDAPRQCGTLVNEAIAGNMVVKIFPNKCRPNITCTTELNK